MARRRRGLTPSGRHLSNLRKHSHDSPDGSASRTHIRRPRGRAGHAGHAMRCRIGQDGPARRPLQRGGAVLRTGRQRCIGQVSTGSAPPEVARELAQGAVRARDRVLGSAHDHTYRDREAECARARWRRTRVAAPVTSRVTVTDSRPAAPSRYSTSLGGMPPVCSAAAATMMTTTMTAASAPLRWRRTELSGTTQCATESCMRKFPTCGWATAGGRVPDWLQHPFNGRGGAAG